MAVLNSVPIPLSDPIARPKRDQYKGDQRDPQEGLATEVWANYLSGQGQLMEKFPARVSNVFLAGQTAAIGATDMTGGTLSAGRYRLGYYARVTTPEGFGATFQITLDWQDGGVTRTRAGAVISGSSTANYESADLPLIYVDALSPVRYAVTYTALGTLVYSLDLVLEEIQA